MGVRYEIGVVSLFPELVAPVAEFGVVGRACEQGRVVLHHRSPREFAGDRHRTVDDRPYGGGPGMVLKYLPVRDAIRALRSVLPPGTREIALTAQGRLLDQTYAQVLAESPGLLLVAGRYEGIDERILEGEISEEVSIGDYVLSGGELAAAVLIDVVVRLLPGVLGHEDSAQADSFMTGLLDCPHYTRPELVDGRGVPPVLLAGDHEAVRRWRLQQALGRTWLRRPALLLERPLSAEEQVLLEKFQQEYAVRDVQTS
jgi:tRNA (guanine37-N1)-methyltransferase